MAIYFIRYVHSKSTKMLSLYYHEIMGKVKKHEGKKCLKITDYVLNKVLDKIKEVIDIEKFNDTKTLIDTDDKLYDDIVFDKH